MLLCDAGAGEEGPFEEGWGENTLYTSSLLPGLGESMKVFFMTLHLLSEAALLMSRIWQCPVESHR